ncbi:hypothetical protein [Rhodopseudomonas parapalustris]
MSAFLSVMPLLVMPGLVPGIHAVLAATRKRRGWPGKSGHDGRYCKYLFLRSFRFSVIASEAKQSSVVRCAGLLRRLRLLAMAGDLVMVIAAGAAASWMP